MKHSIMYASDNSNSILAFFVICFDAICFVICFSIRKYQIACLAYVKLQLNLQWKTEFGILNLNRRRMLFQAFCKYQTYNLRTTF